MTDERDLFLLSLDAGEASGWFGPSLGMIYGIALAINAKKMMEIGVHKGGSTRALLLAAKRTGGHLFSIDISDLRGNIPSDLHAYWTLLVGRSDAVMLTYPVPESPDVDLLFIDGEHCYETASKELSVFGSYVRSGGFIVMDDCWYDFPGVLRAYEEYANCSSKFLLPYGLPHSSPGGLDRTYGIIIK